MHLPFRVVLITACIALLGLGSDGTPPCFGAPPNTAADVARLAGELKTGSVDQQIQAATDLAQLGSQAGKATSALSAALSADNNLLVWRALQAIDNIGPQASQAAPAVAELLQDDGALRESALNTLRQMHSVPADVQQKVQTLCAAKDAAVMVAAVRCCLAWDLDLPDGADRTSDRLAAALANKRTSVRSGAVSALATIGSPAVPALQKALSQSEVSCLNACESLRRIGPVAVDAVPQLLTLLDDERGSIVRAATRALGSLHPQSPEVFSKLVSLLDNESAYIQTVALRAIARFDHDSPHSDAVIDRLQNSDSRRVQIAAADALGHLSYSASAAEALSQAIRKGDGHVTIHAANALAEFGSEAVPVIRDLLQQPGYNLLAIRLLAELGSAAETAVPDLAFLLNSPDEMVAGEVLAALAAIGPHAAAAVPELTKILTDTERSGIHATVAYVLGSVRDPRSIDALKTLQRRSKDAPEVAQAAAWALVAIQPDEAATVQFALPTLLTSLDAEDAGARQQAVAHYGRLQSQSRVLIPKLIEVTRTDESAAVRVTALHSLAALGASTPESLSVALASLNSLDPGMKHAATYLLGMIGAPAVKAAEQLKEATVNGPEASRLTAAWALVRVQPTEENFQLARPHLLHALQHDDLRTRIFAVQILGLMHADDEVEAALQEAANDPDESVRSAVTKVLNQPSSKDRNDQ